MILISFILIIVLTIIAFIVYLRIILKKIDPKYFLKYMKENDDFAFSLKRNNIIECSINSQKKLVLASTVKIIIAIEFAEQISKEKINPKTNISLDLLDVFYLPKTDGGAHPEWINYLKVNNLIQNNQVNIVEIAKGMINFSSNANTEFLINELGLHNINNQLKKLNLNDHDPLFNFVSSVMIPAYLLSKEPSLTKKSLKKRMIAMSKREYEDLSKEINSALLQSKLKEVKKKVIPMSENLQKNWSDRLPKSTSNEYLRIMSILNDKQIFNNTMQEVLDKLMEQLMEHPNNSEWLKHAGQKGGSTLFVITNATYVTDKENNKTEIVFFANNLSYLEYMKLKINMNNFILNLLKDVNFRNEFTIINKKRIC
ncbi:serine hydrolase [Peribacillus sp. NPDC096622]|uniref:serine hydrolase n=1 Tax=Peribacillus sp. NPDC096622 TaxID=3364396 RepID=UPI00380FBC33